MYNNAIPNTLNKYYLMLTVQFAGNTTSCRKYTLQGILLHAGKEYTLQGILPYAVSTLSLVKPNRYALMALMYACDHVNDFPSG